eukprot:4140933-Pyramimonas_sp.AAC.1
MGQLPRSFLKQAWASFCRRRWKGERAQETGPVFRRAGPEAPAQLLRRRFMHQMLGGMYAQVNKYACIAVLVELPLSLSRSVCMPGFKGQGA